MPENPILRGFNPDSSICRVGEDHDEVPIDLDVSLLSDEAGKGEGVQFTGDFGPGAAAAAEFTIIYAWKNTTHMQHQRTL